MKFRKKPIVVDAVQFTGTNRDEIEKFVGRCLLFSVDGRYEIINISTLEGLKEAKRGDWIIKGVNGEFYPCEPDIFQKTYERMVQNE